MVLRKSGLAAALTLAMTPAAFADIQINGFMNVTAGMLSTEDITVDDYDDGVSFDNGTLVGLQMTQQVNDSTTATMQLISRGSDAYETEAAWAYVTYAPTDSTDIRMGRLRTPFFYYSDFLEVGYAYNWIRPPSIVYRLDALSSLSGVDLTQRFSMGSMDTTVQVYAGRFSADVELNGDEYAIELRRAMGMVLGMTMGDFGARVSYHQTNISMDIDPTGTRALDLLAAGAALAGVGDEFIPDEDKSSFMQASVNYDNGSTSVVAEWTALKHDSAVLNDDTAYMISAAQRMGDITAHLTYAETADDLKSGTVGVVQSNAELKESAIILGARFDYDAATAFKAEIQYNDEETVNGADGETGMLYTVGLSLVF